MLHVSDKDRQADKQGGLPLPSAEGASNTLRRQGAPREAVSEEIVVMHAGREIVGWALNRSEGGMRVAFEDCELEVGDTFRVDISGLDVQDATVVWAKNRRGGSIVGLAFGETGQAPAEPLSSFPPPNEEGHHDELDALTTPIETKPSED